MDHAKLQAQGKETELKMDKVNNVQIVPILSEIPFR